jgi:uncharacterized membrane-anchored protein
MTNTPAVVLTKVPEVTLAFWIVKILATTLGETGGDAVTMSLLHADKNADNGGYLIGTGVFLGVFIAAVIAQIALRKFHPLIYWITIVATTTLGTTMADFVDRFLGIGYAGGSSLIFAGLLASLAAWRLSQGSISVSPSRPPALRPSTGLRSYSPRHWARRWATGWPTPTGSAARAALWSFSPASLL